LHLNHVRGLSARRVRYALAGVVVVAGPKTPRQRASAASRSRRFTLKSGTSPNVGGDEAGHEREKRDAAALQAHIAALKTEGAEASAEIDRLKREHARGEL